jgi:hypothetical protein
MQIVRSLAFGLGLLAAAAVPSVAQQNCDAIRAEMTRYAKQAHLASAADVAHLRTLESRYNACVSRDRRGGARSGGGARNTGSAGSSASNVNGGTSGGAIIGGATSRGSGGVPAGIGIGIGAALGTILGEVLSSGPPAEPRPIHAHRKPGFAGCVSRCKAAPWYGNPPMSAIEPECNRSCGYSVKNF